MEAQAASAGPFPVPGLTPPTKRTGAKRRIGDVIVQLGFAERELVEKVVEEGRANGIPLGQSLIDAGIVDSNQLAQALAERNGLDYVDLTSVGFMDSTGLALLINANRRLTLRRKGFAVVCPPGPLRRVFEITDMIDTLHVCPDRESAARAAISA